MTTITAAFAAANRQEHHLAGLLADLKDASLVTMDQSKQMISEALNSLNRSVGQLSSLIQREPPNRQFQWRAKVDSLQQKANLHRSEFVRLISHHHEVSVREQLFSRPENGLSSRIATSVEHKFLEERKVLERADEQVEIAIGQATETLKEMRRQRDTLKGTRTVMLSVLGQLGLSNTVMRLIRRRNTEDRMIIYFGMIVTTLIVGLLIYFFRWR